MRAGDAWAVACPHCLEPALRCCRTKGGRPTGVHIKRFRAYLEAAK